MNNDQEQDCGEFAPAPTVFNDLTSLKHKKTVGPIESAMRERVLVDAKVQDWQKTLAQPEQEPSQWRDMVVVTLVREGINKHKARELADHFAAQRQWVGLTEQDMPSGEDPMFDHQYFCAGMVYAAKVLQEKNT